MFVQMSPMYVSQLLMRAALNQTGHTPWCMTCLIDTQLRLWHTWRRKKQLLIFSAGAAAGDMGQIPIELDASATAAQHMRTILKTLAEMTAVVKAT
jgi:hypothetical protein